MNIFLGLILALACLFTTHSYWKSFLIGAAIYCVVSFFVIVNSAPEGSTVNINADSVTYTFASLLGEFLVPFLFACLIYAIAGGSKRNKGQNVQAVEKKNEEVSDNTKSL